VLNIDVCEEDRRMVALEEVRTLYRHYLESLLFFNLVGFDLPWLRSSDDGGERPLVSVGGEGLQGAMSKRERKIRRHNQLKTLEETRERLNIEQRRDNDESTKRELTLVLLRLWSIRAITELEKIDEEIQVLSYAVSMKQSGRDPLEPSPSSQPTSSKVPFFTIAKSEEQKRVFGAGYPSVPTMTVDEWFDEMQRERGFGLPPSIPDPCARVKPSEMRGAIQQQQMLARRRGHARHEEENEDRDEDGEDESATGREETQEERQEKRERDEWKDTHRRGWGNTHNRG